MSEVLRYEFDSGAARLTLDNAGAGNVLNAELLDRLLAAIDAANEDEACRVIVLGATGPRFCGGMDLDLFSDNRVPDPGYFRRLTDCLKRICRSERPVIAAVEGEALGGGVGLAAACDLVFAGKHARFTLPEVVVGMIPALITPFLRRRMSMAHIRSMTLRSSPIDAYHAMRVGLVDDVADEDLAAVVDRQVDRLFRSAPGAVQEARRYFDLWGGDDLDRDVETALDALTRWLKQPGVSEGVGRFADGFAPTWFDNKRSHRHD